MELGFLFASQATDLEATGVINRSVPQTVYNYHGYFAYNFGDTDAAARPYILGGLGATQYGSLETPPGDIGGETQFSSTWAAGLKLFPGSNFGIRLEGRWTPTYIKTDPEGYWCDPYWGCYTVGGRGVLEPVRALRRHHPPLLTAPSAPGAVSRSRGAAPSSFPPRARPTPLDGLSAWSMI